MGGAWRDDHPGMTLDMRSLLHSARS
jgi:hypothetical protein